MMFVFVCMKSKEFVRLSEGQLVKDPVDRLLDGAVRRHSDAGLALRVVLIDGVVVGHHAHEMEVILLDLLPDAIVQLAAGGTVDDEADLLGAQLQLVDHLAEAAGGLYAAAGAVADQEDGIHLGQDAAAEVLKARLVVHDDIAVVLGILGHLSGEQTVTKQ